MSTKKLFPALPIPRRDAAQTHLLLIRLRFSYSPLPSHDAKQHTTICERQHAVIRTELAIDVALGTYEARDTALSDETRHNGSSQNAFPIQHCDLFTITRTCRRCVFALFKYLSGSKTSSPQFPRAIPQAVKFAVLVSSHVSLPDSCKFAKFINPVRTTRWMTRHQTCEATIQVATVSNSPVRVRTVQTPSEEHHVFCVVYTVIHDHP